jgi:hypothetical protein
VHSGTARVDFRSSARNYAPIDGLNFLLASRELREYVRRVIIHDNNIEILISRAALRQLLETGDRFVPANVDRLKKSGHPDDLILLDDRSEAETLGW